MAGVISFEAITQQAEAHRAQLNQEAASQRLSAEASARRATLRVRLAQALRTLAERLDRASYVPGAEKRLVGRTSRPQDLCKAYPDG